MCFYYRNADGRTALLEAVCNDKPDVVQALVRPSGTSHCCSKEGR
jgi:hypothetical protein